MAVTGIDYSCFACADISTIELEQQLAQCQTDKTNLESQITTLNSTVSSLQTQLAECQASTTDCSSVQSQLDICLSQKEDLQTQLDVANSTITDLNNQLIACNNAKDALQADLNTCLSQKADLQNQLDTANASITDLQGQLTTCGDEKTTIQNNLDACITDKNNIQTQLDVVNTRIADIDSKLQTILGRDVGAITTEEKADLISADKDNIKTAIEAKKGSALSTPLDFSSYAGEINNLETSVCSDWGRPAEWLKIDGLVDMNNEQKAVLLYIIKDEEDWGKIAGEMTSTTNNTTQIDWGDGTVETVSNGVRAHDYSLASIDSVLTKEGDKQVIVTITSSSNITKINFSVNSSLGRRSVAFSDGLLSLPYINNMSSCFRELVGMHNVTFGNLTNCTNFTYAFYNNKSLRRVKFGDLTNADIGNAFKISSVESVIFTDVSTIANIYYCFGSNSSIKKIKIPSYTSSTSSDYFLHASYALEKIEFVDYNNDIYITYAKLTRSAILELFNNLETVTDKTITLTNCLGVASLTDTDKAIATDKGWTLVV